MRTLAAAAFDLFKISDREADEPMPYDARLFVQNDKLKVKFKDGVKTVSTLDGESVSLTGRQTLLNKTLPLEHNTVTSIAIKIHGDCVDTDSSRPLMSFSSLCAFCTSPALEMVDGGVRFNRAGIYRIDANVYTADARYGAELLLSASQTSAPVASSKAAHLSGPATMYLTWTGRLKVGDMARLWSSGTSSFGHVSDQTKMTTMTVVFVSD